MSLDILSLDKLNIPHFRLIFNIQNQQTYTLFMSHFILHKSLLTDCDYQSKEVDAMWIYTPYITRNGVRIYASKYGLKVFRFWVDEKKIR